ncbi:hypothetical protein FQN49_007677 [Arthroderma sp. PD_2]|nr:hypothetical protein FQN49_007677 [Arthroderma sp. PD_2]
MSLTQPSDRRPIVISGPSGVGKGTLCQRLVKYHPDIFTLSVSHTTRRPRPSETDGIDYFFIPPSTFSSLVSQDSFLEHTMFNGHSYGTSKQTIQNQTAKGLITVLDIDIRGVEQIKADSSFDARYVFIKPPSLEVLETRLRERGTETEEDIQSRLARATVELKHTNTPGFFDKIIVNGDLEKAYDELLNFIQACVS